MVGRDPVVIVGGGIAGMTALYENLKHGIPTVLYEKNPQAVGGVVWSKDVGNKSLDMGGELVDTSHKSLLALCKEVGLTPIDTLAKDPTAAATGAPDSADQQDYYFDSGTGNLHSGSDLLTADKNPKKATGLFLPLAEEIRKDYAQMGKSDPATKDWLNTDFNKKLDAMSAQDYLDQKYKKLAAEGKPVDPAVKKAIENAYQCENGRDLKDISALVLVNQLGQGQTGKGINFSEDLAIFGKSDERYKIPGGTSALIERLKEKSEEMARQNGFPPPIQLDRSLTGVERTSDGKTALNFRAADGSASSVKTDYVISALSAPVLAAVPGVENLGLSRDQTKFLKDLQYTNSSKVFFEVKGTPWSDFTTQGADGTSRHITDSDGTFFGDTIKESWITGDESLTKQGTSWVTCLVGGDENSKYKTPQQLIDATKKEYARILGKNPDDIFKSDGKDLGTAILSNKTAGGGVGCYASPGVGQGIASVRVSQQLTKGTSVDGRPVAGFAGSWVTGVDHSTKTPGLEIGYMNVGVESAEKAAADCLKNLKKLNAPKNSRDSQPTPAAQSAIPTADHIEQGGIKSGVQPNRDFKKASDNQTTVIPPDPAPNPAAPARPRPK
jgi:protoporphyrinogen oxidase